MNVYEQALKFRAELLAEERVAAGRMVGAYAPVYTTLRDAVDDLLGRMKDERSEGKEIPASWLYQKGRLDALMRQARDEMQKFQRMAAPLVAGQQSHAVRRAQDDSKELIDHSTASVVTSFNQLPYSAIESLVGFLGDGTPLVKKFDTLGDEALEDFRNAVIQGVALGLNPRQTAKGVRDALGIGLTRALVISRTETLRSYREASRLTYEANSDVVKGWRWVCAKGVRTCAMCLAMDGKEFPLDEPLGTHPNCRCTQVPITKSYDELGIEGIDDKQPKYETGEEWFERQSNLVQKQILGDAKFAAFKRGQITLQDLVGKKDDPDWGVVRWEKSLKSIELKPVGQTPPPAPLPQPPATLPVSDALGVPQTRYYEMVRVALRAIDTVHSDGELPKIPVDAKVSGGSNGTYWSTRSKDSKAVRISVKTSTIQPALTAAHEIGHFIDHQALGNPGEWASQSHPDLEGWRKAVQESSAFKRLTEIRKPTANYYRNKNERIIVAHMEYCLRGRELFARAYAQYIAIESNDEVLLKQLRSAQAEEFPGYGLLGKQWTDGSSSRL